MMTIIRVLSKEIVQNLRNVKAMVMMLLFPLILMLVLGSALSGAFDQSSQFKDVNIIYTSPSDGSLAQAFSGFLTKGREMGFNFTKTQNAQEAVERVKNGNYACFINVGENELEIYENDKDAFKAQLVEGVLGAFIQRYKAISQIALVNPAVVGKIINDQSNPNFVKLLSLGEMRQPKSIDYYAVTMLTLIILYASKGGAYAIKGEKTAKTMSRLLCAPIKKYEVLTGKILGSLVITSLQVLVVILISKFVLKAYWGDHLGVISLLLASEVAMAVSLGIGVAFMVKNESGILNFLIPLFAFFGGSYMPIDGFGKTMLFITNFSPVRWVNKAIFGVIYSNDYSSVAQAIIINLGLAAIFVVIASFSFRKEAI
jgi:ABC-2 type transport system permease protein